MEQDVLLAQQGDHKAFERLYLKHHPFVMSILRRMVGEDAEDLMQEVFIKAWRGIGQFRGESKMSTWLYPIAMNTAKNHLIAARRKRIENYNPVLTDFGPEDMIEADETRDEIIQFTLSLPERLRDVVILRDFYNLEYNDIAEMLDIHIVTARRRVWEARKIRREQDGTTHLRPGIPGGGVVD